MDLISGSIVVGINDSDASRHAMAWAFDEARRSKSHVHLLHVASDYAYKELVDALMHDESAALAAGVVAQARALVPEDVPATVGWVWGPAARILVEASAQARLLVLGSRGRGFLATAALGSVSQHVARHAQCPVVIAHPTTTKGSRVVVGLDPATPDPALPAAFEQASVRNLPLTVLRAWRMPRAAGPDLGGPDDRFDGDDGEQAMREPTRELVRSVAEKYVAVPVEIELTRTDPAQALVAASEAADLVVVGSHGHGWFTGLLLGSTGAAVAAHAHCPVLIAR